MNKVMAILALFIFVNGHAVFASDHEQAHATATMKNNAEVYIISPKNGETVTSPVTVIFGLKGMGIAPAGVDKEHTGHHHLLIDTDIPPAAQAIPSDAHHHHFGKGQTEAVIELLPGEHTLQLLIGDHSHMQHAEPIVSEKITITVQ